MRVCLCVCIIPVVAEVREQSDSSFTICLTYIRCSARFTGRTHEVTLDVSFCKISAVTIVAEFF